MPAESSAGSDRPSVDRASAVDAGPRRPPAALPGTPAVAGADHAEGTDEPPAGTRSVRHGAPHGVRRGAASCRVPDDRTWPDDHAALVRPWRMGQTAEAEPERGSGSNR